MLPLAPALPVCSHVFPLTCLLPPWSQQLLSFIPYILGYSMVPFMAVSVEEAFRGASPCMDGCRC